MSTVCLLIDTRWYFYLDKLLFFPTTDIEYCYFIVKEYNIETESIIRPILNSSQPIWLLKFRALALKRINLKPNFTPWLCFCIFCTSLMYFNKTESNHQIFLFFLDIGSLKFYTIRRIVFIYENFILGF